jgi:hypothetical protein
MREQLLRGFESGLARSYELQLRFAENQRTLIDLMRRVLTLADSRFGKIALEGNRLVFEDAAELETYRSLLAQIRVLAKEEEEMTKEAEVRRQRAVDLFGVPPAGAAQPPAR